MADEPHSLDTDEGHGAWWTRGCEPDYRATLANERTFLAWLRTALALLAGSLAAIQLFSGVPRALRLALAGMLIALSITATAIGYVQWRIRQERMRLARPLGHKPVQALMAGAFAVLAGMVIAMVVLAPGNH